MTVILRRINSQFVGTVLTLFLTSCVAAEAQNRLPPIPAEKMTDLQKKVVREYNTGVIEESSKITPRPQGMFEPWWVYLRVPEIVIPIRRLHEHVHTVLETDKSAIGEKLTHFAILIAARQWTQQTIWTLHQNGAAKAGLKPEILRALADGREPDGMTEDEEILYRFCTELQRNHSVSDATYARALSKFGERGIVEATLIQGLYSMLAMNLNMARAPLAPGTPPPLPSFPR